jgi:hypothetical protein
VQEACDTIYSRFDSHEVVGPGTIDGVHFDPDSLQPMATALADSIRGVFGDTAK